MKKRANLLIVVAALFFAAAVPLTVYAYLQKTEEKENQFTIGEDRVDVTENFTEPTYASMQDTFTKEVKVQNTGTSDQFVRLYLDFSDSRVREQAKIGYTKNDTKAEKSWTEFLEYLPDNWTYIPENDAVDGNLLGGYFYYTKVLEPNAETNALIEEVKTNFGSDSNTDNITDFNIIVYSESVQTVELNESGTVYADDQWKDAWKSFLTIKT